MSYVFDVEISGMYLVVKLRSSGEVVLTPLTEGYLPAKIINTDERISLQTPESPICT